MILWEAVIEEIALEGLDGITLPTLWFRLQSRPDLEFVFDDAGKQWIWSYITQRGDVLSFYQLLAPRPSLSTGGEDECLVDEKVVYPVHIVYENVLWGSCSTLDTRADVTECITVGDTYRSLSQALEYFGAERLVVVASQSERRKALIGHCFDFESLFRDNSPGRQQYAMLERIGRSRYQGVHAGATDSLHAMFNIRAKDAFYVIKRFESYGLIKKQVASALGSKQYSGHATVVMLSRFNAPRDRSKHLAPLRKLIAFLEEKPDKKALFSEVKKLFGIDKVISLKKVMYAFPGIVRTSAEKVDALLHPSIVTKKTLKRKIRKKANSGEGGETQASGVTVVARYFHLVGKLNLDEDNSDKTSNVDDPGTMADDLGDDDEEDDDGNSLQVGQHVIDWSRYQPFRTRVFEMLKAIRQSGVQGVDANTLVKEIGTNRKHVDRLVKHLKGSARFKMVVENVGRRRTKKYIWPNSEHESERYYKKFEEITNLKLDQLEEKEKVFTGERPIRRMLFLLNHLDITLISNDIELMKALRNQEQLVEGYRHALDRKCFRSLMKFLTNHGQVKRFITVIKEGPSQRTVEFVCNKRIDLNSPELQAKIVELRRDLERATAKREEDKSEGKADGDGVSKMRPVKRRKRCLPMSDIPVSYAKRKKKEPRAPKVVTEPDGAWRRAHPAVQRQLRQRHGDLEPSEARRKKRVAPDEVDAASLLRRRKIRAQFSHRERQMLLLMRAVSYVFHSGSRLWVESTVVRDLMHKYVPESLDKTTKTLLQCSARDLGTNPHFGESMMVMAEQLRKHKAIKMIKKRLSSIEDKAERKRWAFTNAFEIARKMFYASEEEIDFDDIDLNSLFRTYDVSVEMGHRTLWPVEDVRAPVDISENTAKRVLYSAVSVSRRDGPYTAQLNVIYKSFPYALLLRVLTRLHQNGMLASTAKRRDSRRATDGIPKKGRDFAISFFYRHFFYHHFHVNLAEEASALMHTMRSEADEWHNILTETPGNVPALIALSWNKQVHFDLTVPSNVVVYNENDESQGRRNGNDGEGDDDNGEGDWPVILFAKTNFLRGDDEDEDADLSFFVPSTSAANQDRSQASIAVVKTELGAEAVRLSCQSANKWTLIKLRQERLYACEESDVRSMTLRVRDLTLNSCTLMARLASNFKDNRTIERAKERQAMNRLVADMAIADKNNGRKERNGEMDETKQRILQALDEKGAIGMTSEELRKLGEIDLIEHMDELIKNGRVYVCGISTNRFVHSSHIDPWTITTFRYTKDERSRGQEAVQTIPDDSPATETIKFMPRPWLKPDGFLNKPMLRWLCEGMFLRIMAMPGVTDSNIQEQFAPVLDPLETYELTEFLVGIGCLERVQKIFHQRKHQLFGAPTVKTITATIYEIPIDGMTRFASVFEKTPLPDFVTNAATGPGGGEQRPVVFGRRRFSLAPYAQGSN